MPLVLLLPAPILAQSTELSHERNVLEEHLAALDQKNKDHAPEVALATLQGITRTHDEHLAVSVLAHLEALDTRVRLDRLNEVDTELQSLRERWTGMPSLQRRVRALRAVIRLKKSLFIEPNAITQVDVGHVVEQRYLSSETTDPPNASKSATREIPPSFPLRFLSLLKAKSGEQPKHPKLLAIFVGLDDFVDASRGFSERLESLLEWAQESDVLLAFFVYTGGTPSPEWDMEERPWNRTVLFWFRGTFERLEGRAVRTRYEWLPGPSIFHVAPGGRLADWCFPWDNWDAFEARVLERS